MREAVNGMRVARITAFLVGALVALLLLAGWRVPAGTATLGADVMVSLGRSPNLELARTGTVLEATALRPGRAIGTTVTVHNPSGSTLSLQPRAQRAGDPALDRLLHVTVRGGGSLLYSGSLAQLAQPVARSWRLGPGSSGRLRLRVSLPP